MGEAAPSELTQVAATSSQDPQVGLAAVAQRREHADRVLDLAREEADLLGPEHLLLGILRDGRSQASRALEAHGVDLAAAREALGRHGVGRVPRTPLGDPPMRIGQVPVHAGEQAPAPGIGVIGPELLLLGVVTDSQTPWPRCMDNRWRRQLPASVGLPNGDRGAAGPLLQAFGVDLGQLRQAVTVELGGVRR